jgi:DNA-directed RNA polymerase beta subunit
LWPPAWNRRGTQFEHGGPARRAAARSPTVDADSHRDRHRRLSAQEVRGAQRTHLPEPEADRESPGGQGREGAGDCRRAAIYHGELALGRNVLVGFMSFDGYNFEDAIIISEELVKQDTTPRSTSRNSTSKFARRSLGREEFTRDIPNVSEKALRNLDENGIVRVGTYVKPGDILVGKVSPKSKTELTPEEKLLHAIFGRAGEDVKNDSLEVPRVSKES